jgi:hypothetical protein
MRLQINNSVFQAVQSSGFSPIENGFHPNPDLAELLSRRIRITGRNEEFIAPGIKIIIGIKSSPVKKAILNQS